MLVSGRVLGKNACHQTTSIFIQLLKLEFLSNWMNWWTGLRIKWPTWMGVWVNFDLRPMFLWLIGFFWTICVCPPGIPTNQFKVDVWWNNHFLCKDLESSNWNNHYCKQGLFRVLGRCYFFGVKKLDPTHLGFGLRSFSTPLSRTSAPTLSHGAESHCISLLEGFWKMGNEKKGPRLFRVYCLVNVRIVINDYKDHY